VRNRLLFRSMNVACSCVAWLCVRIRACVEWSQYRIITYNIYIIDHYNITLCIPTQPTQSHQSKRMRQQKLTHIWTCAFNNKASILAKNDFMLPNQNKSITYYIGWMRMK
jgi:hypothetical protein